MGLGKQIRLNRLFAHPSQRMCAVAVDHFIGYQNGLPPGLTDLAATLAKLVAGKPDEMPETWERLTHRSPVWPSGLYGCTKVWGESLARHFSDAEGVSVLCLRIGAVNRENRPLEPRHLSVWCSQRDIAQMVERCIEAPESLRFDIFYAVSDNRWSYRDLEHSRQVLGFVPQDRAEDNSP